MIHKIPAENLPGLQSKIDVLNKRAKKLSCAPILLTVVREESETLANGTVNLYTVIDVSGESPKINGWQFVGTLEHTDAGNLLMIVPGETLPEVYRTSEPSCDHCHTNRRRKKVHILRHESGEWKQVGSDCIKDFLGHPNAEDLARYAEILSEIETSCEEAKSLGASFLPPKAYSLTKILSIGLAVIEKSGWVSRAKAKDTGAYSTASVISDLLYGAFKFDRDSQAFLDSITDETRKEAGKITEWVKATLAEKNCSDYEWNLLTLANSGIVPVRNIGLAVSMIPCYHKAQEQKQLAGSGDWFGVPGQRSEYSLTLFSTVTLPDNGYGPSQLLKFQDPKGNIATWITTSGFSGEIGKTYTLKATIKDHREYRGIKETVLTRCKVV